MQVSKVSFAEVNEAQAYIIALRIVPANKVDKLPKMVCIIQSVEDLTFLALITIVHSRENYTGF